jgi:hypothetical protein
MEHSEMSVCLEEQQKMLADAVEFIQFKLDPDGPEYNLALASGCIYPVPHCIVKITEFLASLITTGSIEWKDLPSSWVNSVPLAVECVKLKPSSLTTLRLVDPRPQHNFSWADLPDVCRSDVDVVLNGIKSSLIGRWEDIPVCLQSNSDVLWEAWKHILRWNNEYYMCLRSHAPILNRDFFRTCIEHEKIEYWDDLPPEYRESVDFARSIMFFPSESIAFSILDSFPDLCDERKTWVKVLDSNLSGYYTRKLLDLFASTEIMVDRDFMLRACQFDSVLLIVEPPLAHDQSFLVEVLDRCPDQLAHLHHDVQLMFPDLVLSYLPEFARCLPPFSEGVVHVANIRRLALSLHSSFWSERNNLVTWFMAGLPHPHFLDESIVVSEGLNTDEDLMMLGHSNRFFFIRFFILTK